LIVKRYRADAMLEAAQRADQLLEDGEPEARGGVMSANLGGGEDDARHPARCRPGIRLGADKLQHHLVD
jgi:hypothetical protein